MHDLRLARLALATGFLSSRPLPASGVVPKSASCNRRGCLSGRYPSSVSSQFTQAFPLDQALAQGLMGLALIHELTAAVMLGT